MSTECFDVKTKNGRTVAVWRDGPAHDDATGPVVIMAPGFGQRMRSAGVLALMLTYNGATVYRFDALDHVGLSDGEIVDYSVTELMEALTAVVDTALEREGVEAVSMVATSLSALPVMHFAADRKCADNIALMLGVVNGRQTLLKVLDTDYLDWELDDLPLGCTSTSTPSTRVPSSRRPGSSTGGSCRPRSTPCPYSTSPYATSSQPTTTGWTSPMCARRSSRRASTRTTSSRSPCPGMPCCATRWRSSSCSWTSPAA